jgi:drug/metabolite transporter (DMT)-like permease
VIVFVGVFSVLFLNRKLVMRDWGGIFLVIGGLAIVGVSDFFTPSESAEVTNVHAPPSNHSTGQIVLGMFDMFQIEHHGTVVSALLSIQDVPSSNFGSVGSFSCVINLGTG